MLIKASPIVHARTKNIDFRADLLAVPEDFSAHDVQTAKKYIHSSTSYFELVGKAGRRVVFTCGKKTVSGLSIYISDLYDICGKQHKEYDFVDSKRRNYAFIGIVFDRPSATIPFDIPYEVFLAQYEKCITGRWNDKLPEPGAMDAGKFAYEQIDLPEARKADLDFSAALSGNYSFFASGKDSDDSIAAAVAASPNAEKLAFCSDMPNVTAILESGFNVVSSGNANSLSAQLEQHEKNRDAKSTPEGVYPTKRTPAEKEPKKSDLELLQQMSEEYRDSPGNNHTVDIILIAAAVAGAVLCAVSIIPGSRNIVLAVIGGVLFAACGVSGIIRAVSRKK